MVYQALSCLFISSFDYRGLLWIKQFTLSAQTNKQMWSVHSNIKLSIYSNSEEVYARAMPRSLFITLYAAIHLTWFSS